MACGILVPLPGIEPPPPAVEAQISFFLSFLKLCIYFTALGLGCCMQAFSSCGGEGLLSSCGVQAPHCGGGAQALGHTSLVALSHVRF